MSAPDTPERELELIRPAVGDAASVAWTDNGHLLIENERECAALAWGLSLYRRLVELGRHEEHRTQDAETRRALEEG